MIDRSKMWDTPYGQWPDVAVTLFGTHVADSILASVHVRAHLQAGHMNASDPIKIVRVFLRGGGRPHMAHRCRRGRLQHQSPLVVTIASRDPIRLIVGGLGELCPPKGTAVGDG